MVNIIWSIGTHYCLHKGISYRLNVINYCINVIVKTVLKIAEKYSNKKI